MNKKPLDSKPKSYFPVSIKVFSKYSYNKFLKAHPKHLQKLTFDRVKNFDDSIKTYRVTGIYVNKLIKTIKSVQDINFTELCQEMIPQNFNKDIVKRCSRTKKISIMWTQEKLRLIFLSYFYLKSLKNLKALILDVSDGHKQPRNPKRLQRMTSKFLRFLKRTRLERIQYKFQGQKSFPPKGVFNFSHHPSCLKSWSLYLPGFPDKFKNTEELFNLKKLQSLVRFEMLTSLPLNLLNNILQSITCNIKTLAFKATLLKDDDKNTMEEVLQTMALLKKFQALEHLSISSDAWIDIFLAPSYPWKLKSLNVKIQVPDGEYLKKLKEFIGKQKGCIERIDLHLCFEKEPETFIQELSSFFGVISRLKRLEVSRIILSMKGNKTEFFKDLPAGEGKIKTLPILPLIIYMINKLENLREIILRKIGVDFSKDFEQFFQALQKHSETLRMLEIGLAGHRIRKRDFEILSTFKSLEDLRIADFVIADSGFYKCFAETIHRCSALKSLYLMDFTTDIPDRNPQNTVDMLENILGKSNLTAFRYDGAYDSCGELSLKKVYKDFPHIQYFNLPFYTYKFGIVNRWTM